MKKSYVLAIGGNALGNSPSEQREIVKQTAKYIVPFITRDDANVVIVHGNGPQVGMLNLAFATGHKHDSKHIPTLDFPEAIAMTQGYIGFHLQNAILQELQKVGSSKKVVTVITQALVAEKDPSFQKPTKPIGAFYTEKEAKKLAVSEGWDVIEDAGRGWRRVIGSPKPIKIIEIDTIKSMLADGAVVIAGGGGGIPVVAINDELRAITGVIDKDWTAAKIAAEISADMLLILTAVDNVYLDYGTSSAKKLTKIGVDVLAEYLAKNKFAGGSMAPKVAAVVDFVKNNPQGEAIIASLEQLQFYFDKPIGTLIKSS